MSGKRTAQQTVGIAIVVAIVLLLGINVLSNGWLKSMRLDLTENHLYTLSEGTQNILKGLKEPVSLRFFLSNDAMTQIPSFSSYANRVQELLQEYERVANGSISLDIINPEPFSEQEDRALAYGLQGVPLDDIDAVLYFGLVGTSSTDDEEVIPFFSPERENFLEHDLTKLVYQLANPKKPVIGLMSSLPIDGPSPEMASQMAMMGRMLQPWVIVEQMRQLFEVRPLALDIESIDKDIDVLMVVHPKALGDATLYAIDQFVLGGGRILAFVDAYAEADQSGGMPGLGGMGGGTASEFQRLLASWGLTLESGVVAADLQVSSRVQTVHQGRNIVIEYPVWMNVQANQLNHNDIVTADSASLMLATSGILQPEEGAQTTIEPLIQTTIDGGRVDTSMLGMGSDPQRILREYRSNSERLMLAARVTGMVSSAFPDGRPEPDLTTSADAQDRDDENSETDNADVEVQHLATSTEPINIIVVADTDLLQDQFWVQVQNFLGSRMTMPTAGKGNFVINALNNLLGNADLISVRSRGSYSRPFTLVQNIRQDAEISFRRKEQELMNELEQTERKLLELDDQVSVEDGVLLSAQQQQEIERFRQEKLQIRKDLRDVRHELRRDIERLESWAKFANIGLMPIIIGIGGVLVSWLRSRRRRSSRRAKIN